MISSFVAPAILIVAALGLATLLAGRLLRRPLVRRAGAVTLGVALLGLGVGYVAFDIDADCAARGGTVVQGRPFRVEGRSGSTWQTPERCVTP